MSSSMLPETNAIGLLMEFLQMVNSLPTVVVGVAVPWLLLLMYVGYYMLKRPCEVSARSIAPFTLFMGYLTDGATSGFDRPLMKLFHPEILGSVVERGLVRAMVRCLCNRVGKVVHIPRDTVVMKSSGNHVNFVALVDFQHAKQVKCCMSWTWRSSGDRAQTKSGPVRQFYVTSFRVVPRQEEQFDVLEFLRTEDFVPLAESFVERLFERPPKAAVEMMVPALQQRYVDTLEKLQQSIQQVCGGTGCATVEVNATLVSEVILRDSAAPPPVPKDDAEKGNSGRHESQGDNTTADPVVATQTSRDAAVRGIEMRFLVNGVGSREVEVTVVLCFAGLRCYVNRYEVRALPDTRTQVLYNHDTGEKTIIG